MSYHRLYPIDGSREDYRHAIQCQLLTAPYGEPLELKDYIPQFDNEEPGDGMKAQQAYFKMLATKTGNQTAK